MKVIKKDGTLEEFDGEKIVNAVNKSASRVMITLDDTAFHEIVGSVLEVIEEKGLTDIPVAVMHNIVEQVLDKYDPRIATSYRNYRNYKQDFVHVLDRVFQKSQVVRFQGDKENANTDSALVATKRCLIFNELNKRLYRKFFMTQEELQACRDGYIYIHDQSARLDTMNCCLFRVNEVMKGGFEMGNIWYNEPKTLDVFFDVLGDIILAKANELATHTIHICSNESCFPKRYRWCITAKIVDAAVEISRLINMANSVYVNPESEHWKADWELRRGYQVQALAQTYSLLTMMDIAYRTFGIEGSKMDYWTGLVINVQNLLRNWKRSDENRYK